MTKYTKTFLPVSENQPIGVLKCCIHNGLQLLIKIQDTASLGEINHITNQLFELRKRLGGKLPEKCIPLWNKFKYRYSKPYLGEHSRLQKI